MKVILGVLGVVLVGLLAFWVFSGDDVATNLSEQKSTDETGLSEETSSETKSVVSEGQYVVRTEDSIVNWAGKKPLIEGYINSGSIAVQSGSVSVSSGAATGEFVIDMDTLSVSDTPTKPGRESTLEGHLKGDGWFNVEAYPEASFVIVEVTPRADSDTTFVYDVRGELTLKGITDEVTFPASIYEDSNGQLHATADFEFDRTKWGLTAASGSFFDNLADNVIDDMVALSFDLVAEKQ